MKKKLIYCLLCIAFISKQAHAQYEYDEDAFVEQFSYALKFAPRIFTPRLTYEKAISLNSSISVELRSHLLWVPQAVRVEPAYRYYFKKSPISGPYLQAKLSFGYFDYKRYLDNTNGIMAGGGVAAGFQHNIGKRKALLDVFGGFQWVAPFFLNVDPNTSGGSNLSNYDYKVLHYFLIAFPVEIGIRFGFFGTKLAPKTYEPIPSEF